MKRQGYFLLRALMMAVLTVGLPALARAADYIKEVMVIGGTSSETADLKNNLSAQGWTVIDQDLNKGCGSGSDYIYLLYKKESTANNLNWGDYVTDFYISDATGNIPDEITHGGRTYHLVPYEGGTDFKNSHGDLNRGAGGATIHLYYTKDAFPGNQAVSGIQIKNGKDNANGAVVWNGTGEPADLNKGCGSGSAYVYMHVTTATPVPLLSGRGTSDNPYLIGSASDWVKFTQMIQEDQCTEQCFKMTADISVSAMAGTGEHPFHGTFDGNGKTMTVSINSTALYAAPFQYIAGATIQDLVVAGSVTSDNKHAAGLVGLTLETCSIAGCAVSTNVSAPTYAGGIVGHGGTSSLSIADSYYSGTISGFGNYAGGLLGWCDAMTLNMNNCLFKGAFSPSGSGKYHPVACKNSSKTVAAVAKVVIYLNTITPTAEGNYVIPDAQGTPASQTFENNLWTVGVIAPDGQSYYSAPLTMTQTIGNGDNTGWHQPVSHSADFSLVQQIYTPEEIGMAGAITAISFRKAYPGAFSMEGIKVFMQHTDKNEFDTGRMEPIYDQYSRSCWVYEGTFSSTEGSEWATITLLWPFEYDAKSNLLISVYDPTPGYIESIDFKCHASEFDRCFVMCGNAPEEPEIMFDMDLTTGQCYGNYVMDGIALKWINDIKLDISASSVFPRPRELTVNGVTDNTATISWKAPHGETGNAVTEYAYQYKKASDAAWSDETRISGTTTSIVLTGLSALTEYDFCVKSIYGSDESVTLSTGFTTLRALPYEWGFENGLDGWERVDCIWYINEQVEWATETGIRLNAKHDGNLGFQFYTNFEGSAKPQYLVSPQVSGTAPMTVSFYYRNPNSAFPESFQVGYSTTTNNISDFIWKSEVIAEDGQWTKYEENFDVGTKYIAIKYITNTRLMYVDDICFEEYSPYPKPTDLAASDLSEHSAKLSWTKPDNATHYAFQYRNVNEDIWSPEATVNATTVTLSDLLPNTGYVFRVKALFSGGNASNYVYTPFMTEGPVESIPHYQSFENGMGGWRILDGFVNTGIKAGDSYDGGEYCFYFHTETARPQYLISPLLAASADIRFTFWHIGKNLGTFDDGSTFYYPAYFQVGYSNSATKDVDTDSWVWSDILETGLDWGMCSYHFPADTRYVAIKKTSGATIRVDCISIEPWEESITAKKASFYGEEKYLATFYSKTLTYILPEGTVAYTVAEDGEELVFLRIGDGDSREIPSETPVIIVADKESSDTADTKELLITLSTDTEVSARSGNILQASDTPVTVTDGKIGEKTVYVLGVKDGVAGFYRFVGNEIPAGKAYILK